MKQPPPPPPSEATGATGVMPGATATAGAPSSTIMPLAARS